MKNQTVVGHGGQTSHVGESPFLLPLFGTFCALSLWGMWSIATSPLRKYPGPYLARYTNLWRLYHITRGSFHKVLQDLHKNYGPVVRVGPNVVDVDYPDLIKTVFSIKEDWKKTEYYLASSALVDGHIVYNLFSQTDKHKHAQEKRPVAKYYSLNGVLPLEPHVDKTIRQLCSELESRFVDGNAKKPCNLGDWILYYTWDVVGAVTFSQPIGYLSHGCDFDGTLKNAEKALDYFSWVGCIPILDHFFDKNPIYRIGPPGFSGITGVSVKHLIDRYQGNDKHYHSPENPDYLDKFIEAKQSNPDAVSDAQVISWLMINMIAGADTTAITIRSALYYSMKTPRIWQRLRSELAAAGLAKDSCPVSYKDARAIPYLEAVVRESLRFLPGVSLSLERYVPQGGAHLSPQTSAEYVPEGTIVAFNPYVIARNKGVWGPDAEEFRPERWLQAEGESEEDFQARLRAMNNADLSFGGGSRVCIGKRLGLLQVYKVVATLALLYDIELVNPDKEWTIINSWFPRQEGLEVRMSKRA
ncbi:Pisatin demethylase [Diplogelasinospora grovesii]|uniref:Pisatin demethylase n=1 Tax=Diplogelasinospora grovesii TaxID=303347 RepID=A0AAN6MVI8_9PEZI|nr:Pisatin demethylase [Diplogelasinospora grovesii]